MEGRHGSVSGFAEFCPVKDEPGAQGTAKSDDFPIDAISYGASRQAQNLSYDTVRLGRTATCLRLEAALDTEAKRSELDAPSAPLLAPKFLATGAAVPTTAAFFAELPPPFATSMAATLQGEPPPFRGAALASIRGVSWCRTGGRKPSGGPRTTTPTPSPTAS